MARATPIPKRGFVEMGGRGDNLLASGTPVSEWAPESAWTVYTFPLRVRLLTQHQGRQGRWSGTLDFSASPAVFMTLNRPLTASVRLSYMGIDVLYLTTLHSCREKGKAA